LDWFILGLGAALVLAHLYGLTMRYQGKRVFFVQELDRYRIVLLSFTELLPVLGLLGTVLSLMYTFKIFEMSSEETPDLSLMIQAFAPALSTTISGLLMIGPNLVLNAVMWMACPTLPEGPE
jgi:hypothetical protein